MKTDKLLIRQSELARMLDLSRNGFDLLRKRDDSFPKPIKFGDTQQAHSFYVMTEVNDWLKKVIESREM